jgi:hypothetical protein
MVTILSKVDNNKQALVLISLIVVITIVDSQFINIFYPTDFGTPSNYHMLLFISFVIVASVINIILLRFTRRNDIQARTSRPILFRIAYIATLAGQCGISLILFMIIAQMLIFHEYDKTFSLLVMYLSHIWSALILGVLSLTFIQWFRFARSFSILIYGVVFSVILFLILITIPLLTEQFRNQSQVIIPRDYMTVIMVWIIPSRGIAFIYDLGNYVLPIMIVSSWILTVSLLRPYVSKTWKKGFWLIVSIPLVYQLFTYVVRDAGLVTDPALFEIIYSEQFQFALGISYQVSGLLFAIGFLAIARKMTRKAMKDYLIISSIGIVLLFSSMQPGMPFYATYPPFGLVTLLFLGLSSYMLLVGMLGIAANVSRDTELRREIYKGLELNSDMLKKMGMAEMQRELERRILPMANKIKLSEEMRDRIRDPSEEEVKIIINDVLNEIHNMKSGANPKKQQP